MQWVEPKVLKLGETTIDRAGIIAFLTTLGAEEWMKRQPWYQSDSMEGIDPGSVLMEIAGRACYKSFGVGLNPNITKIREDRREYFANLLKKGDGSVIEHAGVCIGFVDVSRVFCYSEDTEVLTNEGWKPWPMVRGNELFASMAPGGELVFEVAEEHVETTYEGPMYHVQSQQVDLLVTPNHRMWVQSVDTQAYRRREEPFAICRAIDLLHKRVRYQKGGVFWRREKTDPVMIPGTHRHYTRRDRPGEESVRAYNGVALNGAAFARFLGYFLAEGHLSNSDTSINLTQNAGPSLDRIRGTIEDMGFKVGNFSNGESDNRRLTFKHVALYDWVKANCGNGALNKRVPRVVHSWSPQRISEVLDALIEGDGNVHQTNGHKVLYTSSKQLADDVQILALKVGLAANLRVDGRVFSHRIFNGRTIAKKWPNYIVSFLRASNLRPNVNSHLKSPWPNRYRTTDGYDDRLVYYSGKVYCVKVKHGLLYVRRNGKPCWSGNTHELVRHRVGTAISQESLRYVRPRELRMTLVPGSELSSLPNFDQLTSELEMHQERYLKLAESLITDKMGFDEKKAWTSALRRILPDGMATNLVWTANHRTLRWVLEMRTAPGAEVEMRYVFDKVGQILAKNYPLIYGDFERIPHKDGVGAQWTPKLKSKV